MDQKLTRKQQYIFDFICDFNINNGFPPSYSDIAKQFNFSSIATVRTYLEHLEKKGYIQRHGKARGIKIIKTLNKSIPIIGEITAGPPTTTYENIIGETNNIKGIKYKKHRFALSIKGNSMINAGILENDIAIIEKTENYISGDIVAILIDDQATLKRIKLKKDTIICIPENENYSSFEINKEDQSVILGKLVGLIRDYI